VTAPRPRMLWIGTLVALVVAVVLLREILFPFVAGMALAYLLDAPVNGLQRFGVSRAAATLLILGGVICGVIALIVLTAPFIGAEIVDFIDKFPTYVRRLHEFATDPSRPWLSRIVGEGFAIAERSSQDIEQLASSWLTSFFNSLWSGGRALVSILSLLIVTPVVTFYLVNDWERIVATVDGWVPAEQREAVRALSREIDDTIGYFLRGQGVICLILAAYYAVALKLVGLNHGFLIGFTAGLISIVPYFGSLTGIVTSLCVAILQFGPVWKIMALLIGIFLIGQLIADYILTPRLIGRRVHLNPVWLMFALFAFGYLFGFAGVLIAVPAAAAIGVVVRFALSRDGSERSQVS
jgi:predicted PurR-regulated permease PerM